MSDDDPVQDAIRNCPEASVPADTILTAADNVRVMVSGGPDRSLVLALHLTLLEPLGDIEVFLGREQSAELYQNLHDLLHLSDEQTDALLTRLHGDAND